MELFSDKERLSWFLALEVPLIVILLGCLLFTIQILIDKWKKKLSTEAKEPMQGVKANTRKKRKQFLSEYQNH